MRSEHERRMRIRIAKAHAREAKAGNPGRCVIAVAFRAAGLPCASVNDDGIWLRAKRGGREELIAHTRRSRAVMHRFDAGKTIKSGAFTFSVPVSALRG